MTELVASLGHTLGVNALWTSLKQKYHQYRIYKSTMRELSCLTDHELADIGIHRSEIKRVAMETYYDNRFH